MSDDSQFENLLARLPQVPARDETTFRWLEDDADLVPVTDAEMRDGLRAAVAEARDKGWIPKEDPGCQCAVCRSFRVYLAADGPRRNGAA